MCDSFLQQYASFINSSSNLTSDIVPTMLFFKGKYCSDHFKPTTNGGGIGDESFEVGTFYDLSGKLPSAENIGFNTAPKSLFVPFNYTSVQFLSDDGSKTKTIRGPFYTDDISSFAWDDGTMITTTGDLNSIGAFTPLVKLDWEETVLPKACMNKIYSIGVFPLERFTPQSQRCDYFMEKFCNQGTNLKDKSICGCFDDLISVKGQSALAGVDLPVMCFGEKCASTRTYKTVAMLSKPCNITICRQILNEITKDYLNTSKQRIYCSGHFFENTGELSKTLPDSLDDVTDTPSTGTSFVVWIVLGISILLFGLVIYLMFTKKSPVKNSMVEDLETINKNVNSKK